MASGSLSSAGFAFERHRFKDLLALGRNARDGYMASGTVTKQEGEHLLTLLAEAVQYQEAHEHSQRLRAEAEAERDRYKTALVELSRYTDGLRASNWPGLANIIERALEV